MARIPDADLLQELGSKFLLNVPASELVSFDRFMFMVEQAHWFYEDSSRLDDPTLKSVSLQTFTGLILEQCPGLEDCKAMLPQIYRSFNTFKSMVPTYGAILLDNSMDYCLLVRGFQKHTTWGFPKGKIASNESEMECAIREVLEETSYNIAPRIVEHDFVETHIRGRGDDRSGSQHCKLFIIQGVDTQFGFQAKCKGEIGAFGWFAIKDLPATAESARLTDSTNSEMSYNMYQVIFFTQQLRSWIGRRRGRDKRARKHAAKQAARNQNQNRGGQQNGNGIHTKNINAANASHRANSSEDGKATSEISSPGTTAEGINGQNTEVLPGVTQPGQLWLNFKFDQEQVFKHLTIPAQSQ